MEGHVDMGKVHWIGRRLIPVGEAACQEAAETQEAGIIHGWGWGVAPFLVSGGPLADLRGEGRLQHTAARGGAHQRHPQAQVIRGKPYPFFRTGPLVGG